MPQLQWSDEYALGPKTMDATHREFIDLLALVFQASDADLMARWQTLVDHTQLHFEREDRWMKDTGFASGNCHTVHHEAVLQVMREGLRRADIAMVRQMADEMCTWFPIHAQAMDAPLAAHLLAVGYDELSGTISRPQALPAEEIHGCSNDDCTPVEAAQAA